MVCVGAVVGVWGRSRARVVCVGAVVGATCRRTVRVPGGKVPVGKGVGLSAVVGPPAERGGTCQIRQRCLPQSEALSEAQRGWYLPPVPAPPLAGPRAVVGAS